MQYLGLHNQSDNLYNRFFRLSFSYILLIILLALVGTLTLYSAANGSFEPWAIRHIGRFVLAFGLMLGLAFELIDHSRAL